MRFLLTSAGIKNTRIGNALVDLLGKPIAESSALCIPTAAYGHPMAGPGAAWRFISGRESRTPMCELGWKSLGVLELTALPSIDEELWVPLVRETDALSGRTSSAGSRPPVAMKRWEWLISRCFRTWITRICRTIPWPTQKDGPLACPCRGTRLTIRPPSK